MKFLLIMLLILLHRRLERNSIKEIPDLAFKTAPGLRRMYVLPHPTPTEPNFQRSVPEQAEQDFNQGLHLQPEADNLVSFGA